MRIYQNPLKVSRLDYLSEVRRPLAAREFPCVRFQRVVWLRRLLWRRVAVLPLGNTRVWEVG